MADSRWPIADGQQQMANTAFDFGPEHQYVAGRHRFGICQAGPTNTAQGTSVRGVPIFRLTDGRHGKPRRRENE